METGLKKTERLRVRSFCSNHYMLVFFICCLHTNTVTHRKEHWVSNQSYNHIYPQFRYKNMPFYHCDHSLRYYKEERLLQPTPRWQMIDWRSYVASTRRLPSGNGGFSRDTWAKRLFQMATNISSASSIIDLTCWPVSRQRIKGKPDGERESLHERQKNDIYGERKHKWICPFLCTAATIYNNSQCEL